MRGRMNWMTGVKAEESYDVDVIIRGEDETEEVVWDESGEVQCARRQSDGMYVSDNGSTVYRGILSKVDESYTLCGDWVCDGNRGLFHLCFPLRGAE